MAAPESTRVAARRVAACHLHGPRVAPCFIFGASNCRSRPGTQQTFSRGGHRAPPSFRIGARGVTNFNLLPVQSLRTSAPSSSGISHLLLHEERVAFGLFDDETFERPEPSAPSPSKDSSISMAV